MSLLSASKFQDTPMATTWPLPDQQQPQQQVVNNPEAVSSSAWHNSGSIGPFFAVISVLTVLAFLSCLLGRVCARREAKIDPLDSINDGSCSCNDWWKRKSSHRCMGSCFDVEIRVIKAKIFGGGRHHECKAQDGVIQNPPSA